MKGVEYKVQTKLETPWIGKPYISYSIVKEDDYFDYDNNTCWGDWVRTGKTIFKSKDKALVEKFIEQLQEKFNVSA